MARRRRSRGSVKIILAIIIILILIGGYINWRNSQLQPGEEATPPTQPTQPAWCKDIEIIAAPGTWESSPTDDPLNPSSHPNSFMLTVTRPLQSQLAGQNVQVWTLPYTAQFKNINDMNQLTYNDSRTEGTNRLNNHLREVHSQCPLTQFIMMGFSQGAVIIGDIVNQIGNSRGVIPSTNVKGVALVADGRRIQDQGIAVGSIPTGVGAEVSLETLSPIIQFVVPGATMRGVRDGGFGDLNSRTYQICADNDTICDAPLGVTDAVARAMDMIAANGIHAQYATNPNVFPGTTTTQWLIDWVMNQV